MKWITNLFATGGRSKADRALDIKRRAADTISLIGLKPDHSVLEIEPGKGWFTGLLLELLADSGKLIVQQPDELEAFFGKAARKRVEQSGRNGTRYSALSWETLDAKDASMDRVVWLQGPHELWFEPKPGVNFGRPRIVFADIARVLKPRGKLLVIDNLAPWGFTQTTAGALHRSVPEVLKSTIEQAGLTLNHQDREWINNENDPLDIPTYNRKVHLKTRQFAQVYTK